MRNMRPFRTLIFATIILLFGSKFSNADDKITIRYIPGYPSSGISFSSILFEIDRHTPSTISEQTDVDRFFIKVKSILTTGHIAKDWTLVPPDAPFIRITIDLNGQKRELTSSHTILEKNRDVVFTENALEPLNGRNRAKVLSTQSKQFLQFRTAFEELLKISSEYLNSRLLN